MRNMIVLIIYSYYSELYTNFYDLSSIEYE